MLTPTAIEWPQTFHRIFFQQLQICLIKPNVEEDDGFNASPCYATIFKAKWQNTLQQQQKILNSHPTGVVKKSSTSEFDKCWLYFVYLLVKVVIDGAAEHTEQISALLEGSIAKWRSQVLKGTADKKQHFHFGATSLGANKCVLFQVHRNSRAERELIRRLWVSRNERMKEKIEQEN